MSVGASIQSSAARTKVAADVLTKRNALIVKISLYVRRTAPVVKASRNSACVP